MIFDMDKNNSKKVVKIVGTLAVISLAGYAVWSMGMRPSTENSENNVPVEPNTQQSGDQSSTQTNTTIGAHKYRNNTYTATGPYKSPAGDEQITVSLTLNNDVISSVSSTVEADNEVSKKLQTAFSAGISSVVVGKKIDEVNVKAVSGASLTTNGFLVALKNIKAEALVK